MSAEFAWRGVDAAGQGTHGRLVADDVDDAVRRLRAQGLVPLAVSPADAAEASPPGAAVGVGAAVDAPRAPGWWRRGGTAVGRRDVAALTHELSVMMKAGLPLAYALRVLIDMNADKPGVQALLRRVQDDVKGGATFSRALGQHGALFSPFYVSMVRAGEASGQLAAVLQRLSQQLARLAALRDGVVSAATYPLVLLVVSLLSLAGMIGFVVPQFERLFADLGEALPLPTRAVLALSHHARQWGYAWLLSAVAAVLLARAWVRRPAGRRAWHAALLRLPLAGPLLRRYQIAVFARTLGTLAGGGVPLIAALDIATDTVTLRPVAEALRGMVAPVKSGSRLAAAMAQTGQFEPLALNLVRVGEETGRLAPMLVELADLTDQRIETGLKRLLTLLEPLLIALLGVLIAAIIVSILLGILSVNEIAV